MNILVIGANGRVGSLVVKEALSRGLQVTGLVRKNNLQIENYIEKDALDLTSEDLKNFDVVVDAVGGWNKQTIPNITNAMIHLANIMQNLNTRLIVVGGAGSLFVNKERTITVDMGKDFPDSWEAIIFCPWKRFRVFKKNKQFKLDLYFTCLQFC